GRPHFAVFGENSWNHVQIRTVVHPGGETAGLAVGVAGVPVGITGPRRVTQAVMVLVDEGKRTLRLVEHLAGTDRELAHASLPAGAAAPYALELTAFDDRLR